MSFKHFVLFSLFILFVISHAWVNIQKFFIFHHSCFGMDIFGTMFWKIATMHKVTFYSVPPEVPVGLGMLFVAPIIYFYFLIYTISQYPSNLLILQPLVIASGVLPLFLLSRLKIGGYLIPFLISVSYLAHPIIGIGATTGFHPLTTFLVFMLWSFYFLETKNLKWFIIAGILANFVKPQACVINMIFSLIIMRNKESRAFGKWLFIVSCFWFLFSLSGIFTVFKLTHQKFMLPSVGLYKYDSAEQFLQVIISQPSIFINQLFYNGKFLQLLFCIFFPLGFLPLLSFSYILPVIPSFIYLVMFPESNELFNIFSFTYLALISTLCKFKEAKLRIIVATIILALSLFSRYFLNPPFETSGFSGPLPFSKDFKFSYYRVKEHHLIGYNLLKVILPGSSCLVTPISLVGHLYKCSKIGIFTVPDRNLKQENWDYILVDIKNLDFSGTDRNVVEAKIKELINMKLYNVLESQDGWMLLRRVN